MNKFPTVYLFKELKMDITLIAKRYLTINKIISLKILNKYIIICVNNKKNENYRLAFQDQENDEKNKV